MTGLPIVPTGWSYDRVDCFFELQRGFDLTQSAAQPGDIPVISSSGISYFHNVAMVQPPGVVTGRKGSLGKVFYVETPFWPHDTTLWVKNFKGNDPKFVATFLGSLPLESHDAATSVPTLNRNNVHSLRVLFPPLPEQRAIAAILSTWDEAITLTAALIDALKRRKAALMSLLLTGKVRFTEFEEEWEEIELKGIGKVFSGGTPDTTNPDYWNGEIMWCTPTEITALATKYISTTERRITEAGLKNSSAVVMPPHSILVCTRATVGEVAINTSPMATNQGFKNLVPSEKHDTEYIYFLLSLHKNEMIRLANGSTFLELSKADFEHMHLRIPNKAEQERVSSVLMGCDEEIETYSKEMQHLQTQKRALMQQLLTGAMRVKVGEEE